MPNISAIIQNVRNMRRKEDPPLAEQAAIVERVEALMTTCRALEAEIGQARRHADQLLQAVLKEAFAPASPAR